MEHRLKKEHVVKTHYRYAFIYMKSLSILVIITSMMSGCAIKSDLLPTRPPKSLEPQVMPAMTVRVTSFSNGQLSPLGAAYRTSNDIYHLAKSLGLPPSYSLSQTSPFQIKLTVDWSDSLHEEGSLWFYSTAMLGWLIPAKVTYASTLTAEVFYQNKFLKRYQYYDKFETWYFTLGFLAGSSHYPRQVRSDVERNMLHHLMHDIQLDQRLYKEHLTPKLIAETKPTD
ncbi:hypothetical protein [Zooshikella harenae]|uniref:Lipoprotein n=1 Tax=Zooshikella harenae TaxID=2827238 RepID=A0ABS5ZBH2_9GAMM|nr:hypothetical protein [Zooshikella harenae]MBU2711411.1 hypothetical protein [Zooshikella harenae]